MKTVHVGDACVLGVAIAAATFIVGLQYGLSLIGCAG